MLSSEVEGSGLGLWQCGFAAPPSALTSLINVSLFGIFVAMPQKSLSVPVFLSYLSNKVLCYVIFFVFSTCQFFPSVIIIKFIPCELKKLDTLLSSKRVMKQSLKMVTGHLSKGSFVRNGVVQIQKYDANTNPYPMPICFYTVSR